MLTSRKDIEEEYERNKTILRLFRYYNVEDLWELAFAQMRHVSDLQDKLPKLATTQPDFHSPREG